MIIQETFIHQNVSYIFRWIKERQKDIPDTLQTSLNQYYNRIISHRIPEELFNDPLILRCSQFRVNNLPRGALQQISHSLIRNKKIIEIDRKESELAEDLGEQLPFFVSKVFNNYRDDQIDGKPSHDTVLHYILIKNSAALSLETPIWNPTNYQKKINVNPIQKTLPGILSPNVNINEPRFTGHIDLLLYSPIQDCLLVSDYKPEGRFLSSLPQVAFYGLFIKKLFRLKKLLCISFNKDNAWIYNPEILIDDIPKYLTQIGSPKFPWQRLTEKIILKEKSQAS